MKYIRTKDGKIFEIVDYEQLDENTKKNVKQQRYVGLKDYLNEKVFVKIYKNMSNPISQYQSIKIFDILKQTDTIEELVDLYVCVERNGNHTVLPSNTIISIIGTIIYGAIWTDKGLIYVAKMNDKGELELL